MENFFIDDKFYEDLDSLISDLDLDDDSIAKLEEDWDIYVEESKLEKIFTLKEDFVVRAIIDETDTWQERFPEDSDFTFEKIEKAIRQGIDLEKMNSLLPELYYPNGKKFKITKKDLIEHIS